MEEQGRETNLMRQSFKCQIEIVLQLDVSQSMRFRKRIPDPEKVLGERSLQISEWCGSQMITDDKKEEGALALTDESSVQKHERKKEIEIRRQG